MQKLFSLLVKILNLLSPKVPASPSPDSNQDSPSSPQEDVNVPVKEFRKGSNVQITKNFNSNEMDCKCTYKDCTVTLIDMDHMEKLQTMRTKWKKSVTISSGYRCKKYNKDVGGATHSRHRKGDATDITVKDISPNEVADNCEHFDGLGKYNSFTHVDSRGTPARWDFRTKK